MKNLKKLGFIFGVGTIAALSLVGCGDDDDTTTTPTAGTNAGGSSAGTTTGTSGSTTMAGTTATGGGGAGTAGSTTTAGTASGGGGSGSGGASGGSGGASGGASGGTGGASGGSGGASGGGGAGGGGGSGGATASADCMKWCIGDNSVLTVCTGQANLPAKINTQEKCLAVCAASPAASVTCWNEHVANAKGSADAGAKTMHCGHGAGADGQAVCPKLP